MSIQLQLYLLLNVAVYVLASDCYNYNQCRSKLYHPLNCDWEKPELCIRKLHINATKESLDNVCQAYEGYVKCTNDLAHLECEKSVNQVKYETLFHETCQSRISISNAAKCVSQQKISECLDQYINDCKGETADICRATNILGDCMEDAFIEDGCNNYGKRVIMNVYFKTLQLQVPKCIDVTDLHTKCASKFAISKCMTNDLKSFQEAKNQNESVFNVKQTMPQCIEKRLKRHNCSAITQLAILNMDCNTVQIKLQQCTNSTYCIVEKESDEFVYTKDCIQNTEVIACRTQSISQFEATIGEIKDFLTVLQDEFKCLQEAFERSNCTVITRIIPYNLQYVETNAKNSTAENGITTATANVGLAVFSMLLFMFIGFFL